MKKLLKKPGATPPTKKLLKPTKTAPGKSAKKIAADRQDKSVVSKTLVKKTTMTETPKKPLSAPQPIVPKGFKWKGKLDAMSERDEVKRFYRIEPKNMPDTYPKLHPAVPEGTVWRMNTLTGVTNALVTVMPDGVNVAWASCAICMNHVDRCICKNGIMMTKGIEWIYIRALMNMDGHPTEGHANAQSSEVTSRALYWYKGKETGRTFSGAGTVIKPRQVSTSTKPATKPAETRSAPSKRLAKKVQHTPEPDINLSKLNKDAAKRSDDLTAEVTKALGGGKKTLKKKKG